MFHIGVFELGCTPLLPAGWVEELNSVCDQSAVRSIRDSRWSDDEEFPYPVQRSEIEIVKGSTVESQLKWLHSLYSNQFLKLAEWSTGRELVVAERLETTVNIHRLCGVGANYEWHTDSNHVTGVLYASTLSASDGGCLTFDLPEGVLDLQPEVGVFLAFDARKVPHAVTPLRRDLRRVSVIMNYYNAGELQTRPPDLDAYLYGEQSPKYRSSE